MPPTRRARSSAGREAPASKPGRPRTRSAVAVPERAPRQGRAAAPLAAPLVAPLAASSTTASAWQLEVQQRLDASERMMGEMHGMLQAVLARDAVRQPPAAQQDGSCPPAVAGPSSPPGLGAVATTTRPTTAPAATSAATNTGGEAALAPPWPTADALTGTVRIIANTMGERTSNFASSSLPIHAHVSARIRAKIWAGEFVHLATLLWDRERKTHDSNSYELSLIPAREGAPPAMQVSEKPVQHIGSFQRWLKAFETYMSIMLLQPHCVADAPKMLQYINTVRNLYERGGNWVLYDETFRAMRVSEGWQWDIVHWELWLNAQPVSGRLPSAPGPSFLGKGKRPQRAEKICYAFNRGVQCRQPCAYSHKCRRCGAAHPFTKCVAGNKRTTPAAARSDRK